MEESSRIYPIYFNPLVSRSRGRKVQARPGAPVPTSQQIAKALTKLQISYKVEKKQHPKHTYSLVSKNLPEKSKTEEIERAYESTGGCFIIYGVKNKQELIKKIADELFK